MAASVQRQGSGKTQHRITRRAMRLRTLFFRVFVFAQDKSLQQYEYINQV
jgi:hypothetical protein